MMMATPGVSLALGVALVATVSCAVHGAENTGSVSFYSGAGFKGVQRRVFFADTDMCVNVKCVEDPVRSVTWSDLYGDGSTVAGDPTQIEFFSGADCTGTSTKFSTFSPNTADEFAAMSVKHSVMSFAVRSDGMSVPSLSVDANCSVVDSVAEAKKASSFNGKFALHALTAYGGDKAVATITHSQHCYDIDLPANFSPMSATWDGMSAWSTLNSDKQSIMYLYNDTGCRGFRRRYLGEGGNSMSLEYDGLTRVQSVILMQYSPFVVDGTSTAKAAIKLSDSSTAASSGEVTLIDGSNSDPSKQQLRKYQVNNVETCYVVACFGPRTTNLTWSRLPKQGSGDDRSGSVLAFYSDTQCQQLQGLPRATATDTLDIAEFPEYKGFQSLMVWVTKNKTSAPIVQDECSDSQRPASTPKPLPRASTDGENSVSESKANVSVIKGVLVGAVASIGLLGVVFWRRRRRQPHDSYSKPTFTSDPSVPMCELDTDSSLRDIRITTEDVRLEKLVGTTAIASIHRGIFMNRMVSVKRLAQTSKNDDASLEDFLYEVKVAAQLDHPKIVRFVGVCWTGMSFLCSVFEHMECGELGKFLVANSKRLVWTRPQEPHDDQAETLQAPLPTKLQLAMDVAEALVLLHSYSPPLTHGNLSSKSVWLSSDGTAKLWDFRPTGYEALRESQSMRSAGFDDILAFGELLIELDWCEPAAAHMHPAPTETDGATTPQFSGSCPRGVVELAQRCLAESRCDRPTAMEAFFELRKVTTAAAANGTEQ